MKSHSGSHFFPLNCRDVRLFSYWLTAKFEKQRGHCSGFVAKERCEQTAGQRLIKGEGEKLKKLKSRTSRRGLVRPGFLLSDLVGASFSIARKVTQS